MGKFPKPWRIEQCDPFNYRVYDANDCHLFVISPDEMPDGKDPPGGSDGPTILYWGEDNDHETLVTLIEQTLEKN